MSAAPDSAAPGTARLAAVSAAILTLFAVLFTAGSALGAWPMLPPGAFLGWDLWIGLAVGLVWLIVLARRGRPEGAALRVD